VGVFWGGGGGEGGGGGDGSHTCTASTGWQCWTKALDVNSSKISRNYEKLLRDIAGYQKVQNPFHTLWVKTLAILLM